MKKLLLVVLLALVLIPTAAWSMNFEWDFQANGVCTNWTAYDYDDAGTAPTYAEENTILHGGTRAQKVNATGCEGGVYYKPDTNIGATYNVSVWVNSASVAQAYLGVDVNGGTDPDSPTAGIQWVTNSTAGAWEKLTVTVKAEVSKITVFCDSWDCVVYFDDLELAEARPQIFGPNPYMIWDEGVYWQAWDVINHPDHEFRSGNPMGHSQILKDGDKAVIGQGDGGVLIYGDESINGTAWLGGTPRWGSYPGAPGTAFYPTKGVTIFGDYLISQDGDSKFWYCTPWEGPWLGGSATGRADSDSYGLYPYGGFIYGADNTNIADPNNATSVIHKFSFDSATGAFTKVEDGIWPVTIPGTHSAITAIGGYNGKVYAAEAYAGRNIFEIDCATGAVQTLLSGDNLIPTSVASTIWHMGQVARCGDTIALVGWSGYMTIWKLVDGVWTLHSNQHISDQNPIAEKNFLGLSLKPGPDGNAKYAWTSIQNRVSFWDLDPQYTQTSLGNARKSKNGYPIGVQGAVVTKTESGGVNIIGTFWAEDKERASAIQVPVGAGVTFPSVGQVVNMTGAMNTSVSGEKIFNPKTVDIVPNETYTINPVYVTNKNMTSAYTGAGAATDGMLVTITGKTTHVVLDTADAAKSVFYIDDGSGVASDVAGVKGVKITAPNMWDVINYVDMYYGFAQGFQFTSTVTGIVRIDKAADGTLTRRIQTFSNDDVKISVL